MQASVSEWNKMLCYSEMLNGAIPIKISKKFIYSFIICSGCFSFWTWPNTGIY